MATDTDSDRETVEVNGTEHPKSTVGIALMVAGGALTALIVTAPLGIPVAMAGAYVWLKHR